MSIDFNKKNVLVIGGSSGIGRGIAESFVNYNANVCITAVSYTHLTLPTTPYV